MMLSSALRESILFAVIFLQTIEFGWSLFSSVFSRSPRNSQLFKLHGVFEERDTPRLLPDPAPNSIGNFFSANNAAENLSFIQCYMFSMGVINGEQYGVGFPVDMPVMLTYFEDDQLLPVRPDYPYYDHLINHVSVQLDGNDFQLYNTPIVLTLQGEFEDEEFNTPYTGDNNEDDRRYVDDEDSGDQPSTYNFDGGEDEEGELADEEEEDRELSLKELLAMVDQEEDDGDDDDDDDDESGSDDGEEEDDEDDDEAIDEDNDEDEEDDSDNDEEDIRAMNRKYASVPDFTIVRPEKPDISDIPADAFVTDEDTKSLKKAHRKADRVIEYAADMKLIASFHYRKKNFHLVRLLEPIFIIGKRINDIKGYYFNLLDDAESDRIRPVLESLLLKRKDSPVRNEPAEATNRNRRSKQKKQVDDGAAGIKQPPAPSSQNEVDNSSTRRSSRRRWLVRKKGEGS